MKAVTLKDVENVDAFIKRTIVALKLYGATSELITAQNLFVNFEAEMLSKLSVLNTKFSFVTSNIAEIQKSIYINSLKKNLNEVVSEENIKAMFDLKASFALISEQLSVIATEIETTTKIPQGSINVFQETNQEVILNFKQKENSKSEYLLIRNGRALISEISDLMKFLISQSNNLEDISLSTMNTVVLKPAMLYEKFSNYIKSVLDIIEESHSISLVFLFSLNIIYEKNLLTIESKNDFINREYSAVKKDLLSMLRR